MTPQPAGPFKALVGMAALIILVALGASFPHMIEWTVRATGQKTWFGIANAVISELLPTAAFLYLKMRRDSKRSTGYPVSVFLFSVVLSLAAQLSSTGLSLPYEKQFLACLPAIAVVLLSIMVHGEIEYRQEIKAAAARAAELAADLAQRDADLAAEQAAERARNEAAETAERERIAAEQAEARAEQRAELQRQERLRIAELQAAAETERERQAAAERAEERRLAAEKQARAEQAQAAREAEAARIAAEAAAEERRIKAEADAALVRAQAAREEAEAQAKKAALAEVAKLDERPAAGSTATRMSRVERTRIVDLVLASLPAGTTRDAAVVAVAEKMKVTERYARDFVPPDWTAPVSGAHGHLRAVVNG